MAEPRGRRRRIGRTVRFRITALATLIVVLVLAVTAVTLVVAQRRSLTSAIDDALRQRADDLAAVYASGALPPSLGVGADETLVQVVAEDGTIVAASENAADRPLATRPTPIGEVIETVTLPAVDDDPFRLLTRPIDGPGGMAVLRVGGSLDDVRDSAAALGSSLSLAIPFVAALLAAVVWWLVGRALRPVETIRAEVSGITGRDLDRRVPVPGSGDEIERLAVTMNRMLDRVEDAGRRQRQFAADASHELRSPLTRMRSELEVDAAHPGSADLVATHRSVLEEIDGLERLLDDLLHLARSDAGMPLGAMTVLDLGEVVRAELRAAATRDEVTVQLTAPAPVPVLGDRRSLARAIGNLLDNAVRHASRAVDVTVESTDGRARVVVADDGPGIPAEARDVVFERFARLDEARSAAAGGTGLGLAIVRDIALRHGGSVWVEETSIRGARFVLDLPASATPATAQE